MSAEVIQNSEADTSVELHDTYHDIDESNIPNDDSNSSLDLKVTHINLTDLSLNDDSYLNSAIGKDQVFQDYTLKKEKYMKDNDDYGFADKIKTNININSASLNTLASNGSNNFLSNGSNLDSYIDDGSIFNLKSSHQFSIINSNTTINVSEEHNANNNEFTENSEFIDIDLEDKDISVELKATDSSEFKDAEYGEDDPNINQYDDDYDLDDVFVDDDMILKSLLNIDNGTTVLLNRVKQNCNSCKVMEIHI